MCITVVFLVSRVAESEQGFVIVLDRRQASWNDVRALLLKMSVSEIKEKLMM